MRGDYMNIVLLQSTAENNRVDKTNFLSNSLTLNGNLRNESSVIDPVILISHTNPTGYNYMYISEFSRYYFIKDIESIRTGIWKLSAHVDVLYSFKDAIMNCRGIVSKTDLNTFANKFYNDGSFVTESRKWLKFEEFNQSFKRDGSVILIAAGGPGNDIV